MATFISKEGLKKEITSPGEYTIGRGPLLEITDKRVSRKHAILKIEEDGTVKFCLRHDNPCYHKPAKSNDFIQLKCDTWQELTDDDQISLLHHSIEELVFTVRINSIKGTTNAPNDDNVELTTSDSNKCALGEEQKMATPPMPLVTSSSSSGKSRKLPSWLLAAKNDGKPTATSKQKSTSRSTGSKSLNKTSSSRKVSSSSSVGDEPVKKEEDIPTATTTTTSTTIASNIPAATSTTTSIPATISTSNTATSTSNTATSTSNTPAATTIPSATSTGTGSDDVLAADDSSRLPSCPYGKKCYRKNPAHFKEYSHSDPDDEEDDKPECPYGMSCYRKNSLHRQQYKHTADTTSATKRTRSSKRSTASKKAKKSILHGDSDDEDEPNTYDYNDSFIDDEGIDNGSSSTSYVGDSEDEDWAPIDSSEDVNELISDAQNIISNKK